MTWKKYHSENMSRWCSSCRLAKTTSGGTYVYFNNGLNRKWVCAQCVPTVTTETNEELPEHDNRMLLQ